MKSRTPAWLALAALVVGGNTALMVWLEGRPGAGRAGSSASPPREIRVAAVPLPEGEAPPVEAEGTPVRVETEPGADVRIVPDLRAVHSPFPLEPLASGTAGADGACVLVPARRVRARAVAEREGFVRAEAPVRGGVVRLPLVREGTVRVRVVEAESGNPVAGAVVDARLEREKAQGWVCDGDGTCVLRGLRAGAWHVVASSPSRPFAWVLAFVAPGGESSVEIRLVRGFTLRGRVLYAGSDRALGEGRISAGGRTSPLGPDGRFELRGLPGPVRSFDVEAGGMNYRVQGQEAVLSKVTGEQEGEVLVALPPNNPLGLQFRGVVRDEEGRPVAGARVVAGFSVLPDHPGRAGSLTEATTDGEGRYRIPSWFAANQILALHPGYAPTHFVLPWRSRNREFDLVLVRGAAVRVAVRAESGRPAGGAAVYTFMRHPDPALAPTQYGDVQGSLRAHPLADGNGIAVLPGMGPGSWYLCARSADGRQGARVVLEVGKGVRALAVELPLRRRPWIGGRIVTRMGVPVGSVDVQVAGEEVHGPAIAARTGADGRFRFEGLVLPPWMPTAGGVPVAIPHPVVGGSTLLPLDRETPIVLDGP